MITIFSKHRTGEIAGLEILVLKIINKTVYKNEIIIKETVSKAIDYAKSIAKTNDMICITGSLYSVGEARDHFDLYINWFYFSQIVWKY